MRTLRWRMAALLAVVLVVLATTVLNRPYADVQRSWLVMGAVLVGLTLAAVLFTGPLLKGARAITDEWKPRR